MSSIYNGLLSSNNNIIPPADINSIIDCINKYVSSKNLFHISEYIKVYVLLKLHIKVIDGQTINHSSIDIEIKELEERLTILFNSLVISKDRSINKE